MEQGWIKLHRSIYNHWLWKEDTKLKWWLDLLLMANHTTRKILLGNNLIEIPRGSLHTSITKLTDRWQADKKTVKKFLDLLQKDSMVSYTTSSHGTTINISNYNDFQDFSKVESPSNAPAMSPSEAPTVSTAMPLESSNFQNAQRDNGKTTLMDSSISIPEDSTMDNTSTYSRTYTVDNPITTTVTITRDNTITSTSTNNMDTTIPTSMVSTSANTMGNTMATNKNVKNKKNLKNDNNAENGEEREEGKHEKKESLCPAHIKDTLSLDSSEVTCETASTTLPPLSCPTPLHEEIHKTLGDIAYRTWFMDAHIASTSQGTTLKVDSPFKRDVINSKFKVQLERILGKIVEVKSA